MYWPGIHKVCAILVFLPAIAGGLSAAQDFVPPHAARTVDCNGNGLEDACDLDCDAPGFTCLPGCGLSPDCNGNGVPDECDSVYGGEGFEDLSYWAVYDPWADGVGEAARGFDGAAFDGRYVYFAPYQNDVGVTSRHGEVLRYDTAGDFFDAAAWAAFDPGDHGVGTDPDGFKGAVFDGRYVYFVPYDNGEYSRAFNGEVLRYDTTAAFDQPSSWATFDAGANGVGDDPDGYEGAVFDGRFIYFVPHNNGSPGRAYHGEALRYDTMGDFQNVSSWAAFNPSQNGVGENPIGYDGGTFDGRYIYFAPFKNATFHGEVLRYDTTGVFASAGSWSVYDPAAQGIGTDPRGFRSAVFDGRYVYFAPARTSLEYHGEVMRYDTAGEFTEAASWATFDPGDNGVGSDPDGYCGTTFDGRFIYFHPLYNGDRYSGEVLRYDTVGAFADTSSWSAFEPGEAGLQVRPYGYRGAVYDGRHLYFAPYFSGREWHSEVLRYDAGGADCNANGVPDDCDIDPADPDGDGLVSEDCNWNGVPDECDPDYDGDGTVNICDNCPSLYNPGQADTDDDTVGDLCDACPNTPGVAESVEERSSMANCADGLDNDCDGQTDFADSDCDPAECLCGDLDGDGSVTLDDFSTFAICFGQSGWTPQCGALPFWCSDLDGSGDVDLTDFATFAVLFATTPDSSIPDCLD